MDPRLESQLAWHVKPGDMIALWEVVEENRGLHHRRRLFLCYSVTKFNDRKSTQMIRVCVLGWRFSDVELAWEEPVDIVSMPTR